MFIAGLDLCSERNVIDQHFLHFGVHQLIAVICLLSELECRRLKVLKFFLHKFNQRTATHGFSTERFRKVERVASCLFRSFAREHRSTIAQKFLQAMYLRRGALLLRSEHSHLWCSKTRQAAGNGPTGIVTSGLRRF